MCLANIRINGKNHLEYGGYSDELIKVVIVAGFKEIYSSSK